jgi:hypothetical protein
LVGPRDLVILGGAAIGVILLVAIAALPPAAVDAAVVPRVDSVPPAAVQVARSSDDSAGIRPATGSWIHGIATKLGSRLSANAAQPTPTDVPVDQVVGTSPPPSDATATPPTPSAVEPLLTPVGNQALSILGSTVPASVRRWEPYIVKYSGQYGLDPNLVAAVMMTESAGNPQVKSSMGAIGLMQVVGGSYDPEQNIAQGTKILAADLQKFGGDLELALAAYNAGAGAVGRFDGIPPYLETQTYVYEVLNRYYLYSPTG